MAAGTAANRRPKRVSSIARRRDMGRECRGQAREMGTRLVRWVGRPPDAVVSPGDLRHGERRRVAGGIGGVPGDEVGVEPDDRALSKSTSTSGPLGVNTVGLSPREGSSDLRVVRFGAMAIDHDRSPPG
jgi:hypothetical protein